MGLPEPSGKRKIVDVAVFVFVFVEGEDDEDGDGPCRRIEEADGGEGVLVVDFGLEGRGSWVLLLKLSSAAFAPLVSCCLLS